MRGGERKGGERRGQSTSSATHWVTDGTGGSECRMTDWRGANGTLVAPTSRNKEVMQCLIMAEQKKKL